ncbi:MAG: MGMT family protein [Fidelibacterota bacterium]|nr:MAG: MGMT family protein [Candidatus Neomarinimicrobiota bacterium]
MPDSLNARIYETVCRIPSGRVATYGQVAREAGLPGQARLVGYALHNLPDHSGVPWHRVVNARGGISLDQTYGSGRLQRALLETEDVIFTDDGRIDLAVYGWMQDSSHPTVG